MKRIDFIKTTAGGLVGLSPLLSRTLAQGTAAGQTPDVVWIENGEPAQLAHGAVGAFGGMGAFISNGDVVVVKPNIGWDRSPEFAADTNPDLVAEVVRLCLDAGARRVNVFDHTINSPLRCYQNSQIEAKADEAGARVSQVRDHRFTTVSLQQGTVLREWPIYRDYLEADKVINMAIAKQHSLCQLTLGMKNLMGVMGGARGELHNGFDAKLVDITSEILPTLTIIDAYRILTRNGPSGGSLADVQTPRTLIMSPCTVTADYVATSLFDVEPSQIGYLSEALERGLNRYDVANLNIQRIVL